VQTSQLLHPLGDAELVHRLIFVRGGGCYTFGELVNKAFDEQKWLKGASGVGEGSRNDTAASLAGKLMRELPEKDWDHVCFPFLEQWNALNTPPLPETELRRTFESIRALEIARRAQDASKEDVQLSGAITLTELLTTDFPEARFAVEQLFEVGTINMLSAPPNKWKSWVVILCAICVASGRNLFGKFKTEQQPVLIVNEEDTVRTLQERCNMLLEDDGPLPIHFHIGKQIRLNEKFVQQLINEARSKGIRMIVFDSLRSVHDADENSSQEMQKVMNELKRITAAGITVLFTHHNRKTGIGT